MSYKEIDRDYDPYIEQGEQDYFRVHYIGETPKKLVMQRNFNLSGDDISEVISSEEEFADSFFGSD